LLGHVEEPAVTHLQQSHAAVRRLERTHVVGAVATHECGEASGVERAQHQLLLVRRGTRKHLYRRIRETPEPPKRPCERSPTRNPSPLRFATLSSLTLLQNLRQLPHLSPGLALQFKSEWAVERSVNSS
jgi:hypothetical protein